MTVGGKSAFPGTVLIILGSAERTKDLEMGKKGCRKGAEVCVGDCYEAVCG